MQGLLAYFGALRNEYINKEHSLTLMRLLLKRIQLNIYKLISNSNQFTALKKKNLLKCKAENGRENVCSSNAIYFFICLNHLYFLTHLTCYL